jgi:hypothetical protein
VDVLIFLRFFIWCLVSGLMRFRDGSDNDCASDIYISDKSATETLPMILQSFGDELMSHTRSVHTNREREGQDSWKVKPRTCWSSSLTRTGVFTRNSFWQAKRSVPNITVAFYGNSVNIWEDFAKNFGCKRTACCITTTRPLTIPFFFFLQEIFYQKRHDCRPHSPYFSLFPHHFDTTEVIDSESQAVLNTQHTAFLKCQNRLERCILAEGDYFEGYIG